MKAAGYESVEMGDGNGQWVFLEIYHDLHCLSYLRKVIYNSTNGLISDDSDPFFKYHVREYFATFTLTISMRDRAIYSFVNDRKRANHSIQ